MRDAIDAGANLTGANLTGAKIIMTRFYFGWSGKNFETFMKYASTFITK